MSQAWVEHYATALRDYLSGSGEAALQRAHELGRQALKDGVGVLDVVARHHENIGRILRGEESRLGQRKT